MSKTPVKKKRNSIFMKGFYIKKIIKAGKNPKDKSINTLSKIDEINEKIK